MTFNIPFKSGIPKIYSQNQDALAMIHYRFELIKSLRIVISSTESLSRIITSLAEQNPQDLLDFSNEGGIFFVIYSPFERKALAYTDTAFHIDSTYNLIENNYPLYVITKKCEHDTIFPLLYFIVYPDTADNLQVLLVRYFQWLNYEPRRFSSDCSRYRKWLSFSKT
ncbi:MULE transposase domain-containing protein [Trichomonas vaginalis G3]|uniref:MULE transposase domain-containing protein n=1 Tax=Trichomonas vaginalis (strain ATCC PRA-98 / G3) TaxID=412133 RepID=UPI0021E54DE6|nr:MULE transposase domain-containing protein [Trichomonas vaginalis G3]KAI5513880.1 MULE transposase domain-containing protein [Trichomonas vaginalis G3]